LPANTAPRSIRLTIHIHVTLHAPYHKLSHGS
jgi:hypothetical protein